MRLEELRLANGIVPVADAFAGTTAASDIHSLRDHGEILWIQFIGVGVTGTQTWTVEACDDVVPTTTTAIVFRARELLTGDVEGAWTNIAATGFTVTAGSNRQCHILASAKDLPAGKPFVRLKQSAEPVDSPCLGGVITILGGLPNRYSEDVNATTIV